MLLGSSGSSLKDCEDGAWERMGARSSRGWMSSAPVATSLAAAALAAAATAALDESPNCEKSDDC